MTIKYQIKDNFINKKGLKLMVDTLTHYSFPWYYQNSVAFANNIKDNHYYFTHLFLVNNEKSSFFYLIEPVLKKLKIKKLIRIKANLYPNLNKKIINDKHIDYNYKHKGAIFYLNTNNGFTILKDNIKIKSVENRLLKFDPSIQHSSTHCTDEKIRLNININYF